ncbi:glycoprotein integral membrane protein 1 [Pelobates fuscus]|uniref:glycoprotein integral membrane protein 1 n=1 Tax=Pelobates fuscus TaxID=191477 RepID=UPI002FE48A7F
MVYCLLFSRPSWILLSCLSCISLIATTSGQSNHNRPSVQETVRLDVTILKENINLSGQIKVNIGYSKGQVQVNGFPVNKGVTRITSGMELWSSDYLGSQSGSVSIRVLVQEWPMNSTSKETRIIVEQEVISFDGNLVQQNKTTEVELLVNEKLGLVTYSSSTIPIEETLLYSLPPSNDVLFTFPNIPETGDSAPQQTTREYNIRQNTTLDEEPYLGKLPETPIRGEMPASSYKLMCQFFEQLRRNLCYTWTQCYPVLIEFLKVVVVGVIEAAIVLEVLKIICPSAEKKGILSFVDIKDSPLLVPLIVQDTSSVNTLVQKTSNEN